jgi:hypothetical protein
MTGQKTFGTGDLNLAAAIATMGVDPDPVKPIELIARDNGRDYVRFHFVESSPCGKYRADSLSVAWTYPDSYRVEHPGCPFVVLMDFITTRPHGCINLDNWQAHAAEFLCLPIDAVRRTYLAVVQTCQASPESPVSYVCAFIRNRMDMTHAAKHRGDHGHISNMMDRGKSVSIIPAKAPAKIRDFLLSHIR